MNKNKRNAKILTSLQERSVKTKMSKDDKHITIDIMSRGKDGKKGTDDDKSMRTNKIKVKGDASPHPQTHKYKAEALEYGTDEKKPTYKLKEYDYNSIISSALSILWEFNNKANKTKIISKTEKQLPNQYKIGE